MGLVKSIVGAESRARVTAGVQPSKAPSWLTRLFGGDTENPSGVSISDRTAQNLSVVYACVRNIAEDVAKLPLGCFVKKGSIRQEIDDVTVGFMNCRPNPETTAQAFREWTLASAVLRGYGVAEIERANSHQPVNFWQLDSEDVNITRADGGKGRVIFEVNSPLAAKTVALEDADVIHIRGLGFSGVTGHSVVSRARMSFGLTAAAEKYGAAFFGNNASPSGIIKTPKRLQDEGKRLKATWNANHQGPGKSRGVGVLEEGAEWQQIGISPEDSQFLETRQFQIAEICRWFRMPPHKVMDLLRGTFSNIEHQSIEYVIDCLLPWIVRCEQEYKFKLFGRDDPRYYRHNVDSLLRGDAESRARLAAIERQWGKLSVNEWKAREDENPIGPDGDMRLVPANMIPADRVQEVVDAQVQGKKTSGTPGDPPPANPENGNQNRGGLRSVIEAHRSLLQDAFQRILRTSADKLRRHAKRDDFDAWSSTFLGESREAAKGNVFPFAEAFASLIAASGDATAVVPATLATDIATRFIDACRRELAAATTQEARASLADRWERQRPQEDADAEIARLITAHAPSGAES